MKPQLLFSFFRHSTNMLWYAMLFITIIVTSVCLSRFAGKNITSDNLGFSKEVIGRGSVDSQVVTNYSADSLLRYSPVLGRYDLIIEPKSPLGYYSFFSMIVLFGLGIRMLWVFKRIFNEANVKDVFQESIYKKLVLMAVLFVLSDIFLIIDYLVFNHLLNRSISLPKFELLVDVGNGLITGIIIYAIATIYRRGLSIQEENNLTV